MKRESFEVEKDATSSVSLSPASTENGRGAAAVSQLVAHILVIDDEPMICQQLERLYTQTGHRVTTTNRVENALEYLANEDVDLVITDMRLPGLSGVDLIRCIQERWPDVPVIVMTGYAHIESAVEVLKLGASDYIVKPFSAAAIQESSHAILEKARIFTEIRHLRRELKERCEFGGMLSKTQEMHRVFEIIRMVSSTDMTVVVEGETGTGKELVASAIHHQSPRRDGPFITINCAGFPETLLESELFGYERGAFTGADHARPGKLELAHGGTLFLDEIENMSISMQTKLLLVLQDQRVQRLGGTRWSRINMRVIAASNVPLKELVKKGQMRQDFYYRINVIPIHLIPLRQRRDDIPLLVQDFLHHHPIALQKKITGLFQKAMTQLMNYTWPGNIRELHNVLEKGIVLTKSRIIDNIDIPDGDLATETVKREIEPAPDAPLLQWVREREKEYLIRKLEAFSGRIDLTAKSCGVDVRTIHRKMRLHGLDKRDFSGRSVVKSAR
ncbi:MAG: sigma-54-dependent transcriptional regulator [Candidatus Binatia bacterium]